MSMSDDNSMYEDEKFKKEMDRISRVNKRNAKDKFRNMKLVFRKKYEGGTK